MSELILPDHLKKEKPQLSDRDLEGQLLIAASVITRSKETIEQLKEMLEANLVIMRDLEIENLKLKGKLPEEL